MTIERVSWEYTNGVKALVHLLTILRKALQEEKIPVGEQKVSAEHRGYFVKGTKFVVAIAYSRPQLLRFAGVERLDSATFARIGVGQIEDGYPYFELDLEGEADHFFSRTADSQLTLLRRFLRRSFTDGRAWYP